MNYRSKANLDIRQHARHKGVFLWQIADEYGVSPETLNKRMRHELNDGDKKEMMNIIEKIAKEQNS